MARVSKHTIKYRHIIETICKDLGINPPKHIQWGRSSRRSGEYTNSIDTMWIHVNYSVDETIRIIMHELRHKQQYQHNRFGKMEFRFNGKRNVKYQWFDGYLFCADYSAGNSRQRKQYDNQPWEKDCIDYEQEITRLFPGKLEEYLIVKGKTNKKIVLDKNDQCVVYFASGKVNYVQTVRRAYEMGIDPNSLKDLDRVKLKNAINNVKAKGVF